MTHFANKLIFLRQGRVVGRGINWTQLNSTDPVEQRQPSQSCFCLWAIYGVTTYKLSQLLFMLSSLVQLSWVELCRYKHPFMFPSRSFRPFLAAVPKLVNTVFWKRMNRFRCKLAQMVYWTRAWNIQVLGLGGQRSRSQEAKGRFGGLAEASFSTPLGLRMMPPLFFFVYFLVILLVGEFVTDCWCGHVERGL